MFNIDAVTFLYILQGIWGYLTISNMLRSVLNRRRILALEGEKSPHE